MPPITVLTALVKVLHVAKKQQNNPARPTSIMQTDAAFYLEFPSKVQIAGLRASNRIMLNKIHSEEELRLAIELYKIASLTGARLISSSGAGVFEYSNPGRINADLREVDLGVVRVNLDIGSLEQHIKSNNKNSGGFDTEGIIANVACPGSTIHTGYTRYQSFDLSSGTFNGQSTVLTGSIRIGNKHSLEHNGFTDNPLVNLLTGGFNPV